MVQAWYMDNELSDQRLEHHRNPPEYVSLDELYKKTGVEYFNVSFAFYRCYLISVKGHYLSIFLYRGQFY